MYFDKNLSLNKNQSCATCHDPSAGFVDPKNTADPVNRPVSEGSIAGKFGGRNSPSAAYAAFSPFFHWDGEDEEEAMYIGGQFWDGRAKTLTEQAEGLYARALQHENDHINGVTIADKMGAAARIAHRKQLKKLIDDHKKSAK